jgi:hypothetical protein
MSAAVSDRGGDQWESGQHPLRTASLEGQLRGDLMPTIADLAEHVSVGHEDLVENDLVEVVLAVHQHDRLNSNAVGVAGHQELAEAGVAMLRIGGIGARQHDDLMSEMGAARPHLGAAEQPTAIGLDGLAGHGGQIRPGAVLAHADRRREPARRNTR